MLVSVIIPCYNVEAYVSECIESILNQTYKEIEIICIDNNSTDSTWKILLALNIKYPKLIIDKEFKAGAPAARNKGLALAKGEWIQYLDADDLLLPEKIAHQCNLIKSSNFEFDFIVASYTRKNISGVMKEVTLTAKDYFLDPFINECGITSSNLWNRKTLLQIEGWNEKIRSSQETELMLRLVLNNKKYKQDTISYTVIRERESGQISQSNPEKKWMQYIQIRIDFVEKLKKELKKNYDLYCGIYYDFLMVSVLTLSKYNKHEAIRIYNSSIKKNWYSNGNYGFNGFKVFLIKTIGLKNYLMLKK